ncbi:hypothetical protein CTEN210_08554 [Chaetoceros tenuissimus]|uniref:MYND-type domain-containing protein n=1 Tax=Chaetoceros tenuissimus TaxID=426638 RepID=A0AAD3CU98_9STRA|nr:hypothetical protein CTEN210_08554 [Chaetoceros tenuissimus]
MPSTTTTKKPDEGSCAACNKEGAVLQCAPCRDAGVDVFFCKGECQVKQWKMHKSACKKTCNGNSKKEDKQEGKKELQHRKDTHEICENCPKTCADIGSKLSVCSKCKKVYYCSRECRVEDWPRHKSQCKFECERLKHLERSVDSTGINIYHLLQKWVPEQTKMAPLGSAVYHASDEKDFEQQPPAKVVLVEVEFNYNVQTFIVAEEPRAVAIVDLSQKRKEMK